MSEGAYTFCLLILVCSTRAKLPYYASRVHNRRGSCMRALQVNIRRIHALARLRLSKGYEVTKNVRHHARVNM